jgi:tripartite-type tricarboxylate transporter receptor subunit TctC
MFALIRGLLYSSVLSGLLGGLCLVATGIGSSGAWAQAFPSKPLRLVIPFTTGGGNDIVARIVAAKMSDGLGQPVVVENRPGAQGIIAVENVAKSAPDGHSILMGPSGPMSINPAIYAKLPYNTLRDFQPISMIGSFPLILVVNPSTSVRSVKDLVEFARANPSKINYGSTAATFQLSSELFNLQTGTRFQHIPYKGSGDMVNAVMSGEITMALADPPPSAGPLKGGKIRGLAITASARHPSWPDLPTLAEAGVPGMDITIWMGLFVPTGTPAAIVTRLHQELVRVLALPDVRERMAGLGVDPSGMSPEEFTKRVAADIARWTRVAREANVKAE